MADKLGFTDWRKNGWWYGGKLTKKNFDEAVDFIKRCNGGEVNVNKQKGEIQFTKYAIPVAGETLAIAHIGDYLMRNVSGFGGQVQVFKPHEFKNAFSKKQAYGPLRFYSITEVEYQVLRSIMEHDTDMCYPYSWIMDYTKLDRAETKKAVDHLRELGIVEFYRGLMTDDGEVAGSGFGITGTLEQLLAELLMSRHEQRRRSWWVTNKDATIDNQRVSGPYSTSEDAALARQIIEKHSGDHTFWLEQLPELNNG